MISLSSRALQIFVAIVDAGSFAGAARRLGIAQPSISAHVKGLERETGARLFDRTSGRQAMLTEAGRSLLVHARDQLERTARLEQELAAGATAMTGPLPPSPWLLPRLLPGAAAAAAPRSAGGRGRGVTIRTTTMTTRAAPAAC